MDRREQHTPREAILREYEFTIKVVVDDAHVNAPTLDDIKSNLLTNLQGVDAADYGIKLVECEAVEVVN